VKLLLDENLSVGLVRALAAHYPESRHVEQLGLRAHPDREIWEAARAGGFVLVSKDDDFRHLAVLLGAPPKVVWLQAGNAGTAAIRDLLIASRERIERFVADAGEIVLALSAR
jgi:predicted nuclease of predicted toxin-antitoxin system